MLGRKRIRFFVESVTDFITERNIKENDAFVKAGMFLDTKKNVSYAVRI